MCVSLPSFANKAIQLLEQNGHSAFAVGGCIRDCLRSSEPKDWEICTSARPEEIQRVFADYRVIETGILHGTLTVLIDHVPVEITTFRIDGEYTDNRHPDQVIFTGDLQADLSRRDFTINAMAYAPNTGLVDPFHGRADLAARRVRCVGDPDTRFQEDALRILRGLRFASVLGFSLDPETASAIHKNAGLLRNIAPERIAVEFNKLLCGQAVGFVLRQFRDVFAVFIPELSPTFDFSQKTKYHIYDVWEHTVRTVENIDPNPILRLTMLFHDIGKPSCFTQDPDGTGHFYGHPAASMQLADTILHRLRYDRTTIREVCMLVRNHDADVFHTPESILHWLYSIGDRSFAELLKIKRADNAAQNPEFSWLDELDRIEALYQEMKKAPLCYRLRDLAVNGSDLQEIGIPTGKELGNLLRLLLDKVMSGELENSRQVLLAYARRRAFPNG